VVADPAKHADALVVADPVVGHLGERAIFASAAPPNSPALPQRSSGTRAPMALMSAPKISDLVERLASSGLPRTSNIRERVALPTDTFNDPPASSTAIPRARPWVDLNVTPRTCRSFLCVSTSIAMRPASPARSTEKIGGNHPWKRTSATLLRTETTVPRFDTLVLFSMFGLA